MINKFKAWWKRQEPWFQLVVRTDNTKLRLALGPNTSRWMEENR